MAGLRLLVWWPRVNPGGGLRLLLRLVPALAADPRVQSVKLLVPADSFPADLLQATGGLPLEVVRLQRDRRAAVAWWLQRGGRVLGVKGTGSLKQQFHRALFRREPDWQMAQLHRHAADCDLVYTFWPQHYAFPRLGKPTVCTFQDTSYFDFPEILGERETEAERRRAAGWVRKADRVIVSSRATQANLARIFGPGGAPIHIIPHAISPADPGADQAYASPWLDQLPAQYVVLPANLSPHKNHYQLLVAWARFARRRQVPLVLFGLFTDQLSTTTWDYWQVNRLLGVIRRNGLRAGRDFYALGQVADADVMPLISHAAALIMPTLAEGGGSYPVEEALSVGVPVLCADIPVMREHLAQHSARIAWFDPESADSIVNALDTLFDHYDEYKQSAVQGIADPRPTWDQIAAQYVDAFLDAVESRR